MSGDALKRSEEVTQALCAMAQGRGSAAALMPLVYDELRAMAGDLFKREPREHTLQPTALVHEAFLKLVGNTDARWEGRKHFFAVAAKAMRQVLVDHARRRGAAKRGGGWGEVGLDTAGVIADQPRIDVLAMDDALRRLAELDPRKSQVVELRFFGGLTGAAAAKVMGISRVTADEDWRFARAWLRRELAEGSA